MRNCTWHVFRALKSGFNIWRQSQISYLSLQFLSDNAVTNPIESPYNHKYQQNNTKVTHFCISLAAQLLVCNVVHCTRKTKQGLTALTSINSEQPQRQIRGIKRLEDSIGILLLTVCFSFSLFCLFHVGVDAYPWRLAANIPDFSWNTSNMKCFDFNLSVSFGDRNVLIYIETHDQANYY